MPDIADPATAAYHATPPEIKAARLRAEHSEQQEPSAMDPVQRSEPQTGSARSAEAATSRRADEQWQLPQWQYATKRGRRNQRRQGK